MTIIIDGTNTPTAGAVAVGDGTTLKFTAAGTAGQVLTSNGASTPTWTDNGSGTVTSVGGTGTVSGLSLSGTVTTSGNLTLGGTLAVTPSNFSSQTANYILAAPNGSSGVPTFRAVVASDIPTLNQNTTGTAAGLSATLAVGSGGTGAASLAANNVILGNGTSAVQVVAPSTSGNVLTSNGTTWQSTAPPAGISLSANNTWTGTQTFNGTASAVASVLYNAAEKVFIAAGQQNANVNAYIVAGSVTYYTVANTANWTQNLTFSGTATLDSVMLVGQSVTMALLSTNGGTAYYPNGFQVDGNSVTPKWQGGTAPTSGNASSIDVYTYTIIKTASATFTVLASQTKFA